MPLYLIKQTFKAGGNLYQAGDLLEDLSDIKLAKIRLNEGKIVEVPPTEEARHDIVHYFKDRYGIDIEARIAARASKGSDKPAPVKPVAKAVTPPPGTKAVKPKPLSGAKSAPIKK